MDMTLLEAAAKTFERLNNHPYYDGPCTYRSMHGVEVEPGFFNIYNDVTSQSKMVLLHMESGYIFKNYFGGEWTASGSYIGSCVLDGVEYRIRIPRFYVFDEVCAQEYIDSEAHSCVTDGRCEHAEAVGNGCGYGDSHAGNWKIFNGEVVLFDFD